VTAAQAKAELEALLLSDIDPSQRWFNVIARARAEKVDLETPLMLLLAGTGLLLLIACGNVSTLLLGEMQTRRHELAIRCALGASRSRLARHLLTESLILGALGSCVGTIFAMVGTPLLVRFGPAIPHMDQISVDLRVLAAGVALAIASAVVFGVPSAYVVTREGASIHLRARALGFSKKASRLSACVVGAEVALTTVILISSVLLGRSFSEMMAVKPGFVPESLAVIAVEPPPLNEEELDRYLSFLEQTSDRLSQIEGVSEVATSSGVPFLQTNSSYVVTPGDAQEDAPSISALSWYVSADFRRVMGIPLLAGRDLTPAEVSQGAPLTLVSESLARELWPDRSPLGKTLRYTESDVLTVVGVVGDIKHKALGYQTEAAFHLPVFDGNGWRLPSNFVVRTRAGAAARLDGLKEAVWDQDPDALIREATTMESLISRSAYPDRYRTLLTAIFATFATFLAAIGLFGVTARSVAQRNSDMAIRMALGARGSTLIRDVLRGGLRVALAGIATGLLLSLWAGYLIRDFLFDVAPGDPLTYLGVAGGLILTSILASYLPARRAASVDPIETLRSE
jgi:predicted permease